MKLTWVFISIVLGSALVYAMRRDLEMDKEFGGDLRNRIVGARLIKDGHSPYFYKWKPGDGTRYYDSQNFDSLKVANITATPFFHHLLAPIADLQQRRLSLLWVYIEYILFGITTLLAFKMAGSRAQQWAVAIVAVLFLFTEAWLVHIYVGQIYIFIPFLAMLFYFMVRGGKKFEFRPCCRPHSRFIDIHKAQHIVFFPGLPVPGQAIFMAIPADPAYAHVDFGDLDHD